MATIRRSGSVLTVEVRDEDLHLLTWLEQHGQFEALGEYLTLWIRDRQAQVMGTPVESPVPPVTDHLIPVVTF